MLLVSEEDKLYFQYCNFVLKIYILFVEMLLFCYYQTRLKLA